MSQQVFNQALCDFIAHSTTPFHAVANMVALLREAGFTALPEDQAGEALPAGGKYYLTRNDSSLVAFVIVFLFLKKDTEAPQEKLGRAKRRNKVQ